MGELKLSDLSRDDLCDIIKHYGARIRELTSDRDSWCNQAADRLKDWDDMRQRAEAAEKRIRELEQDAARYRWLRDPETMVSSVVEKEVAPNVWEWLAGEELDAAIDAARKEKGHG